MTLNMQVDMQEGIEYKIEQQEKQLLELRATLKRQTALLKNSSEIIAIYSETGEITYESPSILRILGYSPEEMVGNNIFDSKTPSTTLLTIREIFNYVKDHPTESRKAELPYSKKNGEQLYLEAIATNLLDEPSIRGIVVNFSDITERLWAMRRENALLENASEIIAIYSEEGVITYESPSITRILGYTPEEMVGSSIFKAAKVSETLLILRDLFNYVKKNPAETKKAELPYTKKNGESVCLEAIATNLLDDPAVKGIIINFRDITERLLAEEEQIERGKMQALSENSKDIIMRLDLNGFFQYANPMLKTYTGFDSTEIIEKSIYEINFDKNLKLAWEQIILDVKGKNDFVEREVDFRSENSVHTMLVSAIPEYDSKTNNLQSILIVSKDISERKKQRLLLERTNKKITDSINYAERIQNSIFPTRKELKEHLQDYFMFYKPRDVISGDFPWLFKRDNIIYFAAVDCTGHGVPGAMMSMIGNLLLNDVVNNEKQLKTPSEVLTNLHKGVVTTLRQDTTNNKTADGMDIALCQMDLDRKKLIFSGAHLPLFLLRGSELITYQGDRFPVGGLQYKSKNTYTDHFIDLEKGDKLFIFSDGIIDQIGGPNRKKWMTRGLKKFILDNKDLEMNDFGKKIESHFASYMGKNKQIDDVILFGVKI